LAEPIHIVWYEGPGGNVEHLADHDVLPDEAESALTKYFDDREPSRSRPDRWVVQGYTPSGRFLVVVFDYLTDEEIVIPITAFELEN